MPRACRTLLFGLPWISGIFGAGCQLITGASERRLVSSEDGCDAGEACAACRPGQKRCVGAVRETCDLTRNYREDLCPLAQPFCTGEGDCFACIKPQDDGNPCTRDECIRGMPSHTELDGTPCTAGGFCTSGKCIGPCNNGQLDGEETGVDCGGNDCLPCADGDPCLRAKDCASGLGSDCSDLATCRVCSDDCRDATCGIPPIIVSNPTCFGVLVLRNGQVVESQSTEGLCERGQRTVRPRPGQAGEPGDVTYLYVQDPMLNLAVVSGTSPDYYAKDWSGRCVGVIRTRAELLQEIQRPANWTPKTTAPVNPATVSVLCDTAALYKW
jgi:hypothetical protein